MSRSLLDTAPASVASPSLAPLRVCLVTEAGGGGVGRHFLELVRGLGGLGVHVTGIYSAQRSDALFVRNLATITKAQLIEFPMRRALQPLDGADLFRLIGLLHKRGPFDVIHGHSSKGGALARLAARWLGVPSIYTPNALVTLDPTLPSWKRRCYAGIEGWLARTTAAIIAVSIEEAEHMRSLGIAADRIRVVHNGIEQPEFPSREQVRSELGLMPDDFVVGFVGRLSPQKAPEVLVEAFAALSVSVPSGVLLVVGDGPLKSEVQERIERLGLGSRVRLLGDIVATQIMPAFDVFCLSSRYEGMPYVLLEALAAGLPIVATQVGGATTCVEPEVNGMLVPLDDVAALAAALIRLASDISLRRRLAVGSHAKAGNFSLQRMIDQTLSIYREVASQPACH